MRVLIADDEPNIRESVAEYCRLEGIEARTVENGEAARKVLAEEAFDAAVLDLRMPGIDGLAVLEWTRAEGPSLPVVMISAHGEVRDAVRAMRLGAADYLVKPFDPDELLLRLRQAVEAHRLRRSAAATSVKDEAGRPPGTEETRNAAMRQVYELVRKAAPTDSTILITGESGTGKEVLARRIHTVSRRSHAPFIAVNLGGLPETLIESELFGYERGAFTGADRRKEGMFELASSGTLFLDEVGDMPLHLQVKLLRVIQERKIQRLGSTGLVPVDVRIVAATHRDLEVMVQEGSFREDLYYRLNVIRVHLPALRERPEDIPGLLRLFLDLVAERTGRHITAITSEAIQALKEYAFPGNVRELENMVERAVILCEGDELDERDFHLHAPKSRPEPRGTLEQLERQAVVAALQRHENNKTHAAEELGVTRKTLFNKIRHYKLDTNTPGE